MYKWNIANLYSQLVKCERRVNEAHDPNELIALGRRIASIEQIIDYYENVIDQQSPSYSPKANLKRTASHDRSLLKKYKAYYPYFEQMLSDLNSLCIDPILTLPSISISRNKLLTVSSDFYNQFKGEISETFAQIKKSLPTHLQFRRLIGTNISYAQTLTVYGSKYSYYDIGLVNSAQDYITLFHELGHGIANYINPYQIYDYNKYCFIETDTLFWELIGYDYLTTQLSLPKDAFLIGLLYLKEYSYDADIICTKQDLHSQFSLSEFKDKKALIDYLNKTANYDKQYLHDVFYDEIKESFHYGISYLTAIELYMIYLADPNIALELLLKIIKAKDLSNEGYLEYIKSLGIIPGKHIKEYVDMLINRGKELGYGKRLYYQH